MWLEWTLRGILSAVFIMAGVMKFTAPLERLREQMPWIDDVPLRLIRVVAASEAVAGVSIIGAGLLTWSWAGISAAAGIIVVMLGAMVVHGRRGEYGMIGVNVALASLAVAVLWTFS